MTLEISVGGRLAWFGEALGSSWVTPIKLRFVRTLTRDTSLTCGWTFDSQTLQNLGEIMASPAKQTSLIRKRKRSKAGKKRKAGLKNNGTTLSASELFEDTKASS